VAKRRKVGDGLKRRATDRPVRARPGSRPADSAAPSAGPDFDTRTRILHTAFQLFHEQGYNATGVATLLRQANVNAGSLYHYFPGKDALLTGVLEYAMVLLRPAVMDPAERRTPDPIERVFELLQQYREGMEHLGCRMGCPIGNLALEVSDDHARARELIHGNFENWAGVVRGWLESAGNRLPENLDRGQLARFVLTVMEGGIMQARAAGHLGPFDDSVAQLRNYFESLQALAGRDRPRAVASTTEPTRDARRATGGRSAGSAGKEQRQA